MDLGIDGRAALVTGGSAGIGLAVAERLAEAGARVALVGRDPARLAAAVSALAGSGHLAIAADLGRAGEPERAVAEAVAAFGGLDILVNNVGAARRVARVEDVDDAAWQASFEINVMSHVRATRAALPALRRSDQARIVNVSSTSGKRPSVNMPDYSVMKAALLSFSRLIADAEAAHGVRVNAVLPGASLTPIWVEPGGLADQDAARSGATRDEVLAKVGASRPFGRFAEAAESADVIAFLCSARASYVSGSAWLADGGSVPGIL